jgi:hypothetical protein
MLLPAIWFGSWSSGNQPWPILKYSKKTWKSSIVWSIALKWVLQWQLAARAVISPSSWQFWLVSAVLPAISTIPPTVLSLSIGNSSTLVLSHRGFSLRRSISIWSILP